MTITRVQLTPAGLAVTMSRVEQPLIMPWIWVRDHSEEGESFDHETKQRKVNTFALDPTRAPTSADVVQDAVHVSWGDDTPDSILPEQMLRRLVEPETRTGHYWRDSDEAANDFVTYESVMNSVHGLAHWISEIDHFGFGLVRDVPLDPEGARVLANKIGYVRRTVFGDVWTLSSEFVAHADSAYTSDPLEPHTDGSYSHDAPGLQLFLCSERTGTGGESVLVDGFAAAETLRSTDLAAFTILSEVAVPGHYIEPGIELRASRPTIALNADGSIKQVTFNNYDRSPFLLAPAEMQSWYEAYSAFHDLIVDESSWWSHRLEPGEALILDNWRCLHGRRSYTGARVFHGCYLNHEDLESRLRVSV